MLDGGPLIVLILGAAIGICFHALWHRFWAASTVAAVIGTLVWVAGCCLLFLIAAPNELQGPLLLTPLLLTFGTALGGSVFAGCVVRMTGSAMHMMKA